MSRAGGIMSRIRTEKAIRGEVERLEKQYPFLGRMAPWKDKANHGTVGSLEGRDRRAYKKWDALVSELAEAVRREGKENGHHYYNRTAQRD